MWHPLFILLYIFTSWSMYSFYKNYVLQPETWSAEVKKQFESDDIAKSQQQVLNIVIFIHMVFLLGVGSLLIFFI